MTARNLIATLTVAASLAAPSVAQAEVQAGPYDIGCFYPDSSPDWNRQAFYTMACIQRNGYWVNGPQPLRLTGVATDEDGTHTLLTRMNYGQQFACVADWDRAKWVSSQSLAPAGVWVTIRR